MSLALILISCGSQPSLPQVAKPQAEEVTLDQVISAPRKFDGALVRVIGFCSVAVENNALYLPENGFTGPAIWLQLGSPVSSEIRALNGKYALVEGRFDSTSKGHEGMAEGTIREISRIEESSREFEAAVNRRVNGVR